MHSSASATSPHHHTSSPCNVAGVKLAAASIDTAKFLDDYEQSVFQNKYRHLLEQETRAKSVVTTASAKDQLYAAATASVMTPTFTGDLHLDAIKEEDLNFKLDHDFGNDDISILNFLEDNAPDGGPATTTTATAVTDHIPPWVVKEEEQAADINLFQDFDTSPALPKPDFRIPPSLEELMGDAEPAERHLDNEIKREDDDSLLKMDVFRICMIRAKRIYMLCDEVTIWIMIIYNIFFLDKLGTILFGFRRVSYLHAIPHPYCLPTL